MPQTILHIDASARTENSISRDLSARIVARFKQADIIRRDLVTPLPLITGEWVGANFTPADDRDEGESGARAHKICGDIGALQSHIINPSLARLEANCQGKNR